MALAHEFESGRREFSHLPTVAGSPAGYRSRDSAGPPAPPFDRSSLVIGRSTELERLTLLAGGARNGHGEALLIRGEPGIGKTALQYAIPAPGNWVWAYGLIANFKPGHQETWVDYAQERAPLLFIGGSEDHIMPPSVNKSNAKHWAKSPSLTEYHEFAGRSHWICAEPGWEEVADYALDWALTHTEGARVPAA